jgi:hypothetical protein
MGRRVWLLGGCACAVLGLVAGGLWWSTVMLEFSSLGSAALGSVAPADFCALIWAQARYRTFCRPSLGMLWGGSALVNWRGVYADVYLGEMDAEEMRAALAALPRRVWTSDWRGERYPIVGLRMHHYSPRKLAALCNFLREGLSHVRAERVVVVTAGMMQEGSPFDWGDKLEKATNFSCTTATLRGILDDDRVAAWFATQHGTPGSRPPIEHPKLHLVPLGVVPRDADKVQSAMCREARGTLQTFSEHSTPPTSLRDRWVYLNFFTSRNETAVGRARTKAWKDISMAVFHDPSIAPAATSPDLRPHPDAAAIAAPPPPLLYNWNYARLRSDAYYAHLATARFTPSPAGTGYDCFRHWEALALGSIPILKHAFPQLDALFADLPVLFLPDFSAIRGDTLRRALHACSLDPPVHLLTMRHWNQLIEAAARTQ